VLVLNTTNGPGFVYLPPTETYAVDGYASWQTPLAAGALERLTAAANEAIEELTDVDGGPDE
jgi:hypothetical protein